MKRLLLVFSAAMLLLTACNDSNDASKNNNADSSGSTTTSSNSSDESKEERNKQVVLESMKGVNNHNVDQVMKDISANMMDYGDGSGPVMKGGDSLRGFMTGWFAAFPDYKGENLMAIADGDQVAVYGDWSGTFKKDFMGMKATGKSFKAKDVDIFTLDAAGKITEHRNIYPFGSIWQQLGVPMKR